MDPDNTGFWGPGSRAQVAAEDAKIGFVFGARGLTMEGTSSFFLPRLVRAPLPSTYAPAGPT